MISDMDSDDDELTATLEQVGKVVFPKFPIVVKFPTFSIWPHDYDLASITRRLSLTGEMLTTKKEDFKSLCMDISESFTEMVNSAVEYPVEDLEEETPADPSSGVKGIACLEPADTELSLVENRLANYDHLTYLTFEQFNDQVFLRKRIREILGLDLSPLDQRVLVQKLMTRTYQEKKKKEAVYESGGESGNEDGNDNDEDDDEVVLTDADLLPCYFNADEEILGCRHYQTNCKIECSICKRWYACRFCHDAQVKAHKLPREQTRHVLCMFCNTPQYPQQYCVNCNKELAYYYCDKCKLFDNDHEKHIYHCDKCGICRLGLGLNQDYFHCDNCNACISIGLRDHHVCIENSTHSNCPICDEYMFDSNKAVVFMSCGHPIHQSCYNEYTKHSYKCPLCSKTVVNMEAQFRVLDKEIEQTVMPEEVRHWQSVVKCVDCGGRSKVPFNYLGLKCDHCNSYNTMQIEILKGGVAPTKELAHVSADDAVIKNALNQNFMFENQVEEPEDGLDAPIDSYTRNFVRVINSFDKYPSIGEAFKDWMSTSMPE